MLINKLLSK